MTAPVEVTIYNNSNYDCYCIKNISDFNVKKLQPVVALPIPTFSSSQTPLFRFSGQTEEIEITFGITNDGTDKTAGTYTNIVTVEDQISYLLDHMYSPEIDTYWTLISNNPARYYPSPGIICCITGMEFDNPSGNMTVVVCHLTLTRGAAAPWS